MSLIDISGWFANKTFTTDWTTPRLQSWAMVLGQRREQISTALEIGCWEGRSSIFFLNYFPNCALTCVDTFEGSPELQQTPQWSRSLEGLEARFDANVAPFGFRVEKIKASSTTALGNLALSRRRFDFIYIDGSHHARDVFTDAALSWPMLLPGGIMVFDDYEWTMLGNEIERPKLGVDAFLSSYAGHYRELHRGYQVLIERIKP